MVRPIGIKLNQLIILSHYPTKIEYIIFIYSYVTGMYQIRTLFSIKCLYLFPKKYD